MEDGTRLYQRYEDDECAIIQTEEGWLFATFEKYQVAPFFTNNIGSALVFDVNQEDDTEADAVALHLRMHGFKDATVCHQCGLRKRTHEG